jgi:hypothetical protein
MSNCKIVITTQANTTYKYKNTKNNIFNYNANIFFTQMYSGVNGFLLIIPDTLLLVLQDTRGVQLTPNKPHSKNMCTARVLPFCSSFYKPTLSIFIMVLHLTQYLDICTNGNFHKLQQDSSEARRDCE